MIESGKTYIVMGLLDRHSLAWEIGRVLQASGGRVVFTIQSETLKKRYIDSDRTLTETERANLQFRFCDVTVPDQVRTVFAEFNDIAGVVHSIAYANPQTLLGRELHTDALDDISRSYQTSAVSLATVVRHAVPAMSQGGSVVAMTFDSSRAFPLYNWMGVHKAALEALVRALARRHGRSRVRVNAVSAGPLATTAAGRIPEFDHLIRLWESISPLPWDPQTDKASVAETVAFLLGPHSRKITGQTLYVDGGASIIGGALMPHEKDS